MRRWFLIGAGACLLFVGAAGGDDRAADESHPTDTGGKSLERKKEEEGALRKRPDPAKDLAVQKENVKRLEHNAAVERDNGNHVGAWAAERDAKHARKLMQKDEQQLRAHEGASAAGEKARRE
jgi:hypothetical protein